jgi:predicted Zn-dependent peptidase
MAFFSEKLQQDGLDRQRDVVKNERRERYENVPYGQVPAFVRAALFPAPHPYHGLAIGTPAELDAVTLDDVRSFVRSFYVPGNASLVIAGDIDPGGAAALVRKYFGPIVAGAPAAVRRGSMPSSLDREVRLSIEADAELARLHVAWPTPSYFARGDAELAALAKILAIGRSSRFERRLVRESRLAQSVSAQHGAAELASVFEIVVTLRPGASADAALAIVDEELDSLRQKPPSDEEVARARAWLTHGLVIATERVSVRANALNLYEHFVRDPGFFERDLARLDAVTGATIHKSLADSLPARRRVIAVVTPSSSAPRAGALRGAR